MTPLCHSKVKAEHLWPHRGFEPMTKELTKITYIRKRHEGDLSSIFHISWLTNNIFTHLSQQWQSPSHTSCSLMKSGALLKQEMQMGQNHRETEKRSITSAHWLEPYRQTPWLVMTLFCSRFWVVEECGDKRSKRWTTYLIMPEMCVTPHFSLYFYNPPHNHNFPANFTWCCPLPDHWGGPPRHLLYSLSTNNILVGVSSNFFQGEFFIISCPNLHRGH